MKNIFALDFGTTKFCLSSLIYDKKEKNFVLGVKKLPAAGMRRGMIVDLNLAKSTLNQLVKVTEDSLKTDVTSAVIGIAGHHVAYRMVDASIPVKKQTVDMQLCFNLAQLCKTGHTDPKREILHLIPVSYSLDQHPSVKNPLGFSGEILHGKFILIDADRNYVKDVVGLCNQAGIEVLKLYSESLASSEISVGELQKDLGVAVVDIGGGTSDGIVYQQGKPAKVFSVTVGGQMMTSDIAVAFNLRHDEAEKVKKYFGLLRNDKALKITNIYEQAKIVKSAEVYNVLACRVYELAELLAAELKSFKQHLGGGIILTGGGSGVQGIAEFLHSLYKIPVLLALPNHDLLTESIRLASPAEPFNSRFATSLGLIKIYLEETLTPNDSPIFKKPLKQLLNWLKELS
jgi:cell division protein FtsA